MIDLILNKEVQSKSSASTKADKNADYTLKSFAKTVSWRVVGTLDTMVISYLVTGQLKMAFSIGSIEVVSKMILYYFHERAWNKFKW